MDRREFLRQTGRAGLGASLATLPLGRVAASEEEGAVKTSPPAPAAGPLRVHPDNRRYFTDGSGKAVYLTGSHTWNNLVDIGPSDPPPKFDFPAFLDFLARHNHNFIRLWTWELVSWNTKANREDKRHTSAPQPFARTGPGKAADGKPKFDLTKFDAEYFNRLRRRVSTAGQRGMYVSVMLFEGWGLQFVPDGWKAHPLHPDNNLSGIGGDVAGDGRGLPIYELRSPAVTAIQEAYVRKVVDTVNDLDNVLYEISNENHPASTKWQYHVIDFVHRYERAKAKQHPVGMTFQYQGGRNSTLMESPAEWVSPNPDGGYRDNPPAGDGRKVILSDTDHLWGIGGNAAWVWKSFLRGLNPLFMDPYDGTVLGARFDKKWEPVRRAMGATLRLANRLPLAAMRPAGELASSGYCLATVTAGGLKKGTVPKAQGGSPVIGKSAARAEYLVYLPEGGQVEVDLSAASGKLEAQWLSPADSAAKARATAEGGVRRGLTAPFAGDALLWLKSV